MQRYRLQFSNRPDQIVNAESAQAAVDTFCADPGNAEAKVTRVLLGDNEMDVQEVEIPGAAAAAGAEPGTTPGVDDPTP